MRDTVLFKPVRHRQQLFAKALQQVQRQPSLIPQTLRQRIRARLRLHPGHGHEQRRVTTDVNEVIEFDDMLVAQRV